MKRSTSVSLAQQTYKDNFRSKRERFFSVSETNYDSVISGSSEEDSFEDVEDDADSEINTFHSLTEWNEYVSRQKDNMKVFFDFFRIKHECNISAGEHSRPWHSQFV